MNDVFDDILICNSTSAAKYGAKSMKSQCDDTSAWAIFYESDDCSGDSTGTKIPSKWGFTNWYEYDKCLQISSVAYVKIDRHQNEITPS